MPIQLLKEMEEPGEMESPRVAKALTWGKGLAMTPTIIAEAARTENNLVNIF